MKLSKSNIIYIDGSFKNDAENSMDYKSQTTQYGYGAFEGLRSYTTGNGTKIFKAKEHFERLKKSCEKISISFNWDTQSLIKDAYKLLEENNLQNAYIRPFVFTDEGMDMVSDTKSHILMMAWEWDSFYGGDLLKTCISTYEKTNPKAAPVDVKITGNYLNSVLAITEAKSRGFDEAILLDMNGFIAESTSANVFIEKDGVLYTPQKGNIMAGITRKTVIQIAEQLDIEVIEKNITTDEFKNADAAFLCGTAVEIIGLKSIDDHGYPLAFADSIGSSIQRVYKSLVLDKLSFEVII
ncbi:aminotransferase class IV [Pedobacter sp. SD-b]|uniref:Aminotransferase class IV n=1 Tax=Pedobacter segetis TaxID=2793069 RepID=A0ABS1BKG4_9SPHI|nr:aminotransferase class IV [Pedobacter segetis]MBK0382826.1 aminotransferase class IV [Pedobacter segetis]